MPCTSSITDLTILDRFPAVTEPAITLTVCQREGITSQAGPCQELIATEDGRGSRVDFGWHLPDVDGPEAEWVYFERHNIAGLVSHGWIDSASRKLLQAG